MLIQVLDYSCKTFAKPYLVLLKKKFFLVFTLIQYWGGGFSKITTNNSLVDMIVPGNINIFEIKSFVK